MLKKNKTRRNVYSLPKLPVFAVFRCAKNGYTSRWYHLSCGEHFCNECFDHYYRRFVLIIVWGFRGGRDGGLGGGGGQMVMTEPPGLLNYSTVSATPVLTTGGPGLWCCSLHVCTLMCVHTQRSKSICCETVILLSLQILKNLGAASSVPMHGGRMQRLGGGCWQLEGAGQTGNHPFLIVLSTKTDRNATCFMGAMITTPLLKIWLVKSFM